MSTAQWVTANVTGELLQSSLNCTSSFCVIRCLDLLSCAFTAMTIESTETVIECDAEYSCLSATVIVDEELVDHSITILCLGVFCFILF